MQCRTGIQLNLRDEFFEAQTNARKKTTKNAQHQHENSATMHLCLFTDFDQIEIQAELAFFFSMGANLMCLWKRTHKLRIKSDLRSSCVMYKYLLNRDLFAPY